MNMSVIEPTNKVVTLSEVIKRAMDKLNLTSEAHLTHYLPGDDGNRMHHFTVKRLKKENPKRLCALLEKFILAPPTPQLLPSIPRQGKQIAVNFNRLQLNRLIDVVTASGDEELTNLLRPYQSFADVQKQMKQMTTRGEFDPILCEVYRKLSKIHQDSHKRDGVIS